MDRAIPAFYACYLLRSTIRHQSLYVGSTPNPVRRLKQHNGESKGGAARTARDSLRPWEMTCLVTGFPSKVAALQFEWAWQNTHLTRHVSPASRLTQSRMTVRFSPKTGRMRKRSARPRLSLTDCLANLHQLLQSRSFGRWPLRVTFYCEDIFRVWEKWAAYAPTKLQPHVEAKLDEPSRPPSNMNDLNPDTGTGIYALDVGYKALKPHLEKSRALQSQNPVCVFCRTSLPTDGTNVLTCPGTSCNTAGHVACFAAAFLGPEFDELVPIEGNCPACEDKFHWIDLVKESSLRNRAPQDVGKMLKPKKGPGGKLQHEVAKSAASDSEQSDLDAPLDDDDWNYLSDTSEDEPKPSPGAKFQPAKVSAAMSMPEPFIEDSDWDEAEVVM